jgi:hypothetical protein
MEPAISMNDAMPTSPRWLILVLIAEALGFALLVGALADRKLHQRDPIYGVNQWGYRGEARGLKLPGEFRVAVVGGSSAFEVGMDYGSTAAGQIYIELRAAGAPRRQEYSVVNLSEPRAGVRDYVDALRDYSYLRPDLVCIYDGYDTLDGAPPHGRRRSTIFRVAGYLPLLPARLLGTPAWLSDGDGGVAPVLAGESGSDVSCSETSQSYCDGMAETVRAGLERGYAMMVVSPPSVSARHAAQQRSLGALLERRFGSVERFMYIDLGSVMDMADRENSPDGVHRTDVGNHIVGQRIASNILRWPAVAAAQGR